MGTLHEDVFTWLKHAVTQPCNSLTFMYYFDRRKNELFPLWFFDRWLMDEDLQRSDMKPTWSPQTEGYLMEKLRALELEPDRLVHITRIPGNERKNFMQGFIDDHESHPSALVLRDNLDGMETAHHGYMFDAFTAGVADVPLVAAWERRLEDMLNHHVHELLLSWQLNPEELRIVYPHDLGRTGDSPEDQPLQKE